MAANRSCHSVVVVVVVLVLVVVVVVVVMVGGSKPRRHRTQTLVQVFAAPRIGSIGLHLEWLF